MQNAAFKAAGLDWSYEIAEVAPEQLAAAATSLRADDVIGANVTIPYKVAVIPHLDRVDGEAVEAGAVNTIRRDGELLIGPDTDVVGPRVTLGAVGVEPLGARGVVLGVGLPGKVLDWTDPSWHTLIRHADLLLNATHLGWREEMPLPAPIDAMKAALPE